MIGIDCDEDGSCICIDEVVVVSDEEVPEDACLVEVAEADHVLDALHGGGVVVRDLAVRSCVLSHHNVLKIADYGLGRAAFPADYWPLITESVPLRWAAPGQLLLQQHRTVPEYRAASREDNLWSLGIILWELLTYCHQPYRGLSDKEVMQLLLDRENIRHHFRSEPQTGLKYKCVAQLALNNLDLDPAKR